MIDEVPFARRNPALFGLIPSAMYATFTPAPSMPSDAAVLALGSSERALMVCSASGSSWGFFLVPVHAAGSTVAGAVVAAAAFTAGAAAGASWTRRLRTT